MHIKCQLPLCCFLFYTPVEWKTESVLSISSFVLGTSEIAKQGRRLSGLQYQCLNFGLAESIHSNEDTINSSESDFVARVNIKSQKTWEFKVHCTNSSELFVGSFYPVGSTNFNPDYLLPLNKKVGFWDVNFGSIFPIVPLDF